MVREFRVMASFYGRVAGAQGDCSTVKASQTLVCERYDVRDKAKFAFYYAEGDSPAYEQISNFNILGVSDINR